MITETQISVLQKTLQNYPQVLFAYLFGSQATGKVTPMSDVDSAVYFDERLSSTEQFKLQLHLIGVLCQALQRNDVELAVLNDEDVVLRYEVLKNGKLIFCRDKDTKNEFFVQTFREYLDTEPMRAFHREKMKAQILRKENSLADHNVMQKRLERLREYLELLREIGKHPEVMFLCTIIFVLIMPRHLA